MEGDDRRAKLARLREQGIDPFPHEFEDVEPTSAVEADTDRAHRVAGRIVARRDQGGAAFIDLVDRAGKLQLYAKRDELGDESFDRLVSLDIGDLIGVDGTSFVTRRGQLSLLVADWKLLAKSLRDIPKEHYGLENVETRYRHRELDLIANAESRELFIMRSNVVSGIRNWLDNRGFLEVETPILQRLYGGALA
ncbi:MAG: amino acid--tRNA ligase-related protein, partial [Gaiellaceae bacterium]